MYEAIDDQFAEPSFGFRRRRCAITRQQARVRTEQQLHTQSRQESDTLIWKGYSGTVRFSDSTDEPLLAASSSQIAANDVACLAVAQPRSRQSRKLVALMYADVANFCCLVDRNEDDTHRTLSSTLDHINNAVKEHAGGIAHFAGDSVLAEFASASAALHCAHDIQTFVARFNTNLPRAHQLKFRIGINVGDVIEDGHDLFGNAVNVTERIQRLAIPGHICMSEAAFLVLGPDLQRHCRYQQRCHLQHIRRPTRVYRMTLYGGRMGILPVLQRTLGRMRKCLGIAGKRLFGRSIDGTTRGNE